MPLASGARLGPYEVVGPLGAGGMGEVYRARDARLGRDVALKILPATHAGDADRSARFRREAQLLASLNHPNIAAIYGLEESTPAGSGQATVTAIVLELVDGQTLADRLTRGAIPVKEALTIARQIADALEAAHDRGVIHRDLKPANIKLTADGQVKVLDFGLAKLLETEAAAASASMSPTLSVHATLGGVILGTAPYMSPEQARGRQVDRRADVWAFGCVLFEMLTATRAFPGEDVTDIFAAIVKDEPAWSALPADTPPAIRQLLTRCLEKDARERLPSIGSARLEIRDAMGSSASRVSTPPALPGARTGRVKTLAWMAAAVVLVAGTGLAIWALRRVPADAPAYRSSLLPPDKVVFSAVTPATRFAVSPDGRRLAFIAIADGVQRIWVRQLAALTAQPLTGTDAAVQIFWSYDSQHLAFVSAGKLRTIDVTGGPPIAIADSTSNNGGSWNRDNVIVYMRTPSSEVYRVNASGGTPAKVTAFEDGQAEVNHWQPFFLPDGRRFLFHLTSSKSHPDGAIYVSSLDDGTKRKLVIAGGSNAQYALGRVLFLRDTTLMAQRFDTDRLEVRGDPVPVAEQIQVGGATGRTGAFSVSETGVLVYQTGLSAALSRLAWMNRSGTEIGPVGEEADYSDLELSSDQSRLAVSVLDPARRLRDLWLFDVKRGLRTRFTFGSGGAGAPIWSPDGGRVVFAMATKGQADLYQKAATGAGEAVLLYEDTGNKSPTSWSPDGRGILFTGVSQAAADLLWLALPKGSPTPFLRTPFSEAQGRFSPDGQFVAYASNESGRNEVYVTPARGQTGKWQVSTGGGTFPRWRHDGKELYYIAPDSKLMAAVVDGRAGQLDVGSVKALFDSRRKPNAGYPFDVAADGQRFLVNTVRTDPSPVPLTLVVNWHAGLP